MQNLPTGLSSCSVDTNISSFFPDLRLPMAVSRSSTGLAFSVIALCKIEAAFLVLPNGAKGRKMLSAIQHQFSSFTTFYKVLDGILYCSCHHVSTCCCTHLKIKINIKDGVFYLERLQTEHVQCEQRRGFCSGILELRSGLQLLPGLQYYIRWVSNTLSIPETIYSRQYLESNSQQVSPPPSP